MADDHVFLITADGLRYDRVSGMGYEVETTPHLDGLAATGASCKHAIVTGTGTRKSFPGILTSSYPLMYGGYAQLTDHRRTLASAFREAGYATLGINGNAQLHSRFGWDRGFDVYFDSEITIVNEPIGEFSDDDQAASEPSHLRQQFERVKSEVYQRLDQNGYLYRFLESGYRAIEPREPPHPTAKELVDRTLEFVDRAPDDRPLFVWVHFMETHSPYVPDDDARQAVGAPSVSTTRLWNLNDRLHSDPESLTDEEVAIISGLYDASLRELDDEIGRLIDGLIHRDVWEGATVAFTSDHGEEFREHGSLTHCVEPYDVGAHVPLLFRLGSGSLTDIDGVTSTIDIGPTLLEAAVDEPPIPDRFHGRSLCPVLRNSESIPDDRVVFIQNANRSSRDIDRDRRITGCRTTEWKYITSRDERIRTKLFYLPTDPDELENLAARATDRVEYFETVVSRHYDQPAYTDYDIESARTTGDVGKRLEALGYLDH